MTITTTTTNATAKPVEELEVFSDAPEYKRLMARFGRHVMRYKGNLAVKGFFAYLIYRDLAYRSQMHQTSFVTLQQEGYMIAQTAMHTGAFLGLCAMI